MPTAVMTASREKTASRTTICVTMTQKLAYMREPDMECALPSTRSCISMVPLKTRKKPPVIRIRSRPEKLNDPRENKGSVSLNSQKMAESSARRMTSASDKPMKREIGRASGRESECQYV